MEQFEDHLAVKASEIVNTAEFCTSLVHQNVLQDTDIQLATASKVQERVHIEKVIKAACSKKAIGSLVVALQRSSNERILVETYDWLETSQARIKNYPISIKSLGRQRWPTATGLFAATGSGLIFLDLQTLEATTLTSEQVQIYAVAVNHNLKKVYWSQGCYGCSIIRSNFDGSAKEVIVRSTPRDMIYILAIDEATGNLYFSVDWSHKITVCNAIGKNLAAVISNISLVQSPQNITVDSVKGVMYWDNYWQLIKSIVCANLDGSNATTISTEFNGEFGITLDQPLNDVLYWAERNTIGTIAVNGSNKQTLARVPGLVWRVQADAHKIYFNTFYRRKIQSVDRYTGEEYKIIFETPGVVRQVALFIPPA